MADRIIQACADLRSTGTSLGKNDLVNASFKWRVLVASRDARTTRSVYEAA